MDMNEAGWWKPFFFIDPTKVQVLFSFCQIEGTGSLLLYSGAVAALCTFDRWAAAKASQLRAAASSPADDTTDVAWWALQRLSGGLVMLVMMSFNAILFAETVVFLGLAELAMVRTQAARRADAPATETAAFAPLSQLDDDAGGGVS